MASWLNYRVLFVLSIPLFLGLGQKEFSQKKWGFFGHKRINRVATFTLPPEMFGFYKEHIEYLTEHAVDPDKRRYAVDGEAQRHYVDIDHYSEHGENPFEIVPRRWKDAVEKFSEDTLQAYGIVPWHIMVMKYRLQRAFESKNVDLILKYSADIGHYIGDANVPLHTTENYNGQLTDQKGIHGLWESRLVEINYKNYDYFVGKADYLENLEERIWQGVMAAHFALDSVFQMELDVTKDLGTDKKYSFEQRGSITTRVYSYEFSQEYHRRMNGMVERRLRSAISTVGSVWYTAWVDAGQPDLSKMQNTPPSAELIEEMKALEVDFHSGEHKGRVCE
ncbi:MAG: S1/P1 Nuclease [Fluviicola sp.]|nr:S1/P1 Nuclease [Fluviicola sp.]